MATFVMQSLGCDVSAINTVHYSNHTAYKQVKGTKTSAEEMLNLYEGLRQSNLTNFDVLLTGYVPSAEAVQAIGKIGRDVKFNAGTKPGSFFWVLDPVMGDNGKLYIPEDEVPEYKALLREADLILPNQFEAEAPSKPVSTSGSGPHTPSEAQSLDASTSHPSTWPTSLSSEQSQNPEINLEEVENLTIIGSTATSDYKPRLFRIDTPQLPLFFSGTGDMFAALTVPRLIEAVQATPELSSKPSWRSPDDVPAEELPLAKAAQKVLASMQAILTKTTETCQEKMKSYDTRAAKEGRGEGDEADEEVAKKRHLALTNASEVKVVRYVKELLNPPNLERFKPKAVPEGAKVPDHVGERQADELKVLHLGVGPKGEGAVQVQEGETTDKTLKGGLEGEVETDLKESGLKDVEPNVLESKEAEKFRGESSKEKP
ncbi:hypothetical protein SNOG_04136 [Parastagonospora nodorum SN15]|uniref:pyridoxal kinase n=1 Tax=Phaeosphaeria nodorum (strain SN15 / ATCC MYA-4574 / FGSC 10173) TaxID=321614 RepID=Q0UVS8_PHANO|nr:hypothetical protein SNOG_04136 [Parastagonospora nodorum SN15]EAT87896.2 hypothetical protein SNOG_04136 [Parastagonospora nodorum SN15]